MENKKDISYTQNAFYILEKNIILYHEKLTIWVGNYDW
jgi:hypothetical protein